MYHQFLGLADVDITKEPTQAVLRVMAEAFGVPRQDVTPVTGATSRDKSSR